MKKLIASLLLFIPMIAGAEQAYILREFAGNVDKVWEGGIADKYTPDSLNVYTDEFNCISKRRGFVSYLNSPFPGQRKMRKLYKYTKTNGDSYIIGVTSNTIFASRGDGNTITILSGIDSSWEFDFATAKDTLYGFSVSTTPFKWDASTFTWITAEISTGMVRGSICRYIDNRMLIAGVPGFESRLYFSEVNDPENIGQFNYVNVNINDGDKITGVTQSQGKTYVFKTYSTWDVYDLVKGFIRNVSPTIGCLYASTIDDLDGYPVWVSARGVELYDGTFNLISDPIDTLMKNLRQLKTQQSMWIQTSAEDWGAGSGVNIDTTTYNGSVAMTPVSIDTTASQANTTVYSNYAYSPENAYTQSFRPTRSGFIKQVDVYFRRPHK